MGTALPSQCRCGGPAEQMSQDLAGDIGRGHLPEPLDLPDAHPCVMTDKPFLLAEVSDLLLVNSFFV